MEKKPFDYNSFIGMILLGAIMLWYFQTNKTEIEPEKTSTEQIIDSTKNNVVENKVIENTAIVQNDSAVLAFKSLSRFLAESKIAQLLAASVRFIITYLGLNPVMTTVPLLFPLPS